jgi:RND family efflux transporter MFP subunit
MKKLAKYIKRKLTRRVIIVLVVICAIIFGWKTYSKQKMNAQAQKYSVEKGQVSAELILTGAVKADEDAVLYFPAAGKISWVGVKEGDKVAKGQALASLDRTTLNAAYQQALNNVRMYEANVDYVHDELKGKDTSETFSEKDTRTTAEVAKDNAYDSLRAAEYNLANATLISPFAGVVSFLAHPFSGVNILPTESQVEIVNPKTIYFEVTADQSEVVDIKMADDVKITLDSYTDKQFDGKVGFISIVPLSGEAGTVYKIRVVLTNPEADFENLRIGMTGDASFTLASKDNVLYAPLSFVKTDKKGKYVNLGSVDNKVYVQIGLEGENNIEITSGVSQGDVLFD